MSPSKQPPERSGQGATADRKGTEAAQLSALVERLTPPIFTHWLRNAQHTYPFVKDLSCDQQQLRSDVTEAFEDALASAAEKPAEKPPGYAYYFICGFIEGFLNSRWYFRYVVDSQVLNDTLCVIMAMRGLFKRRPDLEEPLGELFEKNRDDFKVTVNPAGKETSDAAGTPHLDRAVAFLENALIPHFRPMRESKCEDFCPDIDRFLKQKDVKPFLSRQGRNVES